MSDTSKTIVLTGLGGYEKLKIEQKAKPTPDEGQVSTKYFDTVTGIISSFLRYSKH